MSDKYNMNGKNFFQNGENESEEPEVDISYDYTFSHRGGIFSEFEGVATSSEAAGALIFNIFIGLIIGISQWFVISSLTKDNVILTPLMALIFNLLFIRICWNLVIATFARRMHAFGKSYLKYGILIPLPLQVLTFLSLCFEISGVFWITLSALAAYTLYWLWKFLFVKTPCDK